MDYEKKRTEILEVWADLFQVCKAMVKRVKSGKDTINASLLKEVNAFLRLSLEMMERNIEEEEQRKRDEENQIDESLLPDFGDDEDLGDSLVDPLVRPLRTNTLEF